VTFMGGPPALRVMEGKQAAAWHEADTCWTTSCEGQRSSELRLARFLQLWFDLKYLTLVVTKATCWIWRRVDRESNASITNNDSRCEVCAVKMVDDILINTETDFSC